MESEENKDEYIEGFNIDYFKQYFGTAQDYYIPQLLAYENGTKYSFNAGPFFLGIFWFLYRKLYIHSLLIFLFVIAENQIELIIIKKMGGTEDLTKLSQVAWIIIYSVILGYVGNYFYLKNAKKKVIKIISSDEDELIKLKKLEKAGKGGWILILLVIVCLAFILIFGVLSSSAGADL